LIVDFGVAATSSEAMGQTAYREPGIVEVLVLWNQNQLNKLLDLQSRVVCAAWRPRRGSAVSPPGAPTRSNLPLFPEKTAVAGFIQRCGLRFAP
jgi:hypothetical protein